MNSKKQKGGIITGTLWIVSIVFFMVIGSQIVMALIAQQTIKGAVKSVLIEQKGDESATPRTIVNAIDKKLSINNLELTKDEIYVEKQGRLFSVEVNYQKEIGITDNFKILMDLSFSENTPQ